MGTSVSYTPGSLLARARGVLVEPSGAVTVARTAALPPSGMPLSVSVARSRAFRTDGHEYVAASDRDFGLYILEYTGGR